MNPSKILITLFPKYLGQTVFNNKPSYYIEITFSLVSCKIWWHLFALTLSLQAMNIAFAKSLDPDQADLDPNFLTLYSVLEYYILIIS